jgi:hypothetical protein
MRKNDIVMMTKKENTMSSNLFITYLHMLSFSSSVSVGIISQDYDGCLASKGAVLTAP